MPPRKNALLEGPILRSLLTLAVPIVTANVLQSAYQIIDAFWVGRLGGAAIAAVSISFPVLFLTFAIGSGLSLAGSTLIAQYVGARNDKMVAHVAGQTLLMVILASVVLGTIGYFSSPALLRLMGVGPDVYPGALGFMRISFVGIVFNFTFFVFQAIMRGIGRPTLPVYIVLGTVFLNFVLDPLLIFGWGPVPGYGVMGAAIATLITQAIAAAIGIAVLRIGLHGIHVRRRDFIPDFGYVKRAFFLGLPASVELSARALGLMVMTFLIASFGTLTLAAFGVGANILQVVMVPAMGLSMAISTLVGQNIGAGNIERAAQIGRLGGLLGFASLSVFGLIVFLFAPQFVAVFVPGGRRRDRSRRGLSAHHVARLGFPRPAVRADRRVPRLGQHGADHGADPGIAMGRAVSTRLCPVQAHGPARAGTLVVAADRQHRDGVDHARHLRQGRLEEEAPDRAGGRTCRQGDGRHPGRRSLALSVSPSSRSARSATAARRRCRS